MLYKLITALMLVAAVANAEVQTHPSCNADNCLRALRRNQPKASSFCASYPRAKETEAAAPAACSTGQVVVNPSFYGPPPIPQPQLSPWVIGHDSGSPGCVFNPSSYDDAARDQYFADPASIKCAFPKTGGQDHVSQEIFNMCPNLLYTLTYHVACDYLAYDYHSNEAREATSIAVYFDGRQIQSKHLCPTCEANNLSCSDTIYTVIKENLFGPASGHGTLTFEISQDAVDIPSFPLLLDIVYLEGQGYDGPPFNPLQG
ncbi:MAG: hypothetical protein HETSPECPRED_005366 [Heterodermia speciosa]|uniref:Uncharacterized protein n=1 Tax=Heterodermia speciosa TaxID=116794 RepID=A0A8H3FIT4_9LECA|nr:MAG: hypothetical protein HETSPECPRED_005366 [Heterodermia speciosa]